MTHAQHEPDPVDPEVAHEEDLDEATFDEQLDQDPDAVPNVRREELEAQGRAPEVTQPPRTGAPDPDDED